MTADVFDDAAQPTCPHCGIVMRDVDATWACPSCGHTINHDPVVRPPQFEGPDLDDYRQRR